MPGPIISGAANGAVFGAVAGGLIYAAKKALKSGGPLHRSENSAASRIDQPSFAEAGNPYRSAPPLSDTARRPSQDGLIVAMWLLTFAAMLVSFQGAKALGVSALLDLPAFVIAIVLLCSPGVVNKGNGGIKLFLELVALAVGLFFAFHPVRLNHTRAVYPYPVSPVRQIPGQPPFHAHFPPQPPMPINPPWVR